jgi:hypothetical protein
MQPKLHSGGVRALLAISAVFGLALAVACARSNGNSDFGTPPNNNGLVDGGDNSIGDGGGFPNGPDSGIFILPSSGNDAGDSGSSVCDGGPCTDFPSAPVMDTNGMPSGNPSQQFGNAGTGSTTDGPCLAEPADGALFPYNWLRPRVLWTPGTKTQTTFEVRIHADLEANDYVVYTTKNYWTLDKPTWQAIAGVPGGDKGSLVGQTLSITVRAVGASGGTPAISNTAKIQIAPAIADGSLIYWTTPTFGADAGTTLQGFHVGDEGVATALTPQQVVQQVWAGPPDGGNFPNPQVKEPVGCIGCHTATPDGVYVGFTAQWPWPNAIASVQADGGAAVGAAPPWLTPSAIDNLGPNTNDQNWLGGTQATATNNVDNVMLGIQTFSPAHYQTGDRREITTVGAAKDQPQNMPIQPSGVTSQLIWVDLEFTGAADAGGRPSAAPGAPNNGGWGILARGGDTNSAGAPDWSHDGKTVAYTSVNGGTMDGRLDAPSSGSADIKTVPYSNGAGGTATSVPGASESAYNEYFPAFAPDDALIAFNRVGASDTMYSQPKAEVYVVPVSGSGSGTAVRLSANDPVQCTGQSSPGVQNTWPKWAPNPIFTGADAGADAGPAPQVIDGITYYWITFSSTRSPTALGRQQLYVAGVIVDPQGQVHTYAPIYLWNQSDEVNNLIPAWGEFAVPPGKAPPPPPPPPIPPK